jgi:hypothetical protein
MRGLMMAMALTLPLAALAQTPAPADSSASASTSAPAASAPADSTASTSSAPAPAPAAAPAASDDSFGSQTRLWLATQTSGANSVTEERPMPGEVASLVYQRYLNSFTHPIPERYTSESFRASGTGGGTSSSP